MIHIEVADGGQAVAQAAYRPFKELLVHANNPVFGLATGSSPIGLYQVMVADHRANGISWQNVRTVNLDEYVGLKPDHPQSYAYFMHQHLFDHVDLASDRIHLPEGSAQDLEGACVRYDQLVAKYRPDIQLLGIGSNGHIGFNEPGTSFASTTHIVDLQDSTIKDNSRFFQNMSEVPKQAMTMGIASIMNARKIVLIAMSEHKAWAIRQLVNGPIDEQYPCSVLQKHPDVTLILDEGSASLL